MCGKQLVDHVPATLPMGIYFLWPLLQGRRITLGQRTEVKQECIQLHYILQGVHLCEHSISPKVSKCIIKRYLPQVQLKIEGKVNRIGW